ncbi:MAG: hypothetical protein PHW53_04945 [Patescibacteria group bacterium]|nr:hypothetical protein [Patescibacteria group bacterium]
MQTKTSSVYNSSNGLAIEMLMRDDGDISIKIDKAEFAKLRGLPTTEFYRGNRLNDTETALHDLSQSIYDFYTNRHCEAEFAPDIT